MGGIMESLLANAGKLKIKKREIATIREGSLRNLTGLGQRCAIVQKNYGF